MKRILAVCVLGLFSYLLTNSGFSQSLGNAGTIEGGYGPRRNRRPGPQKWKPMFAEMARGAT
jgi:hypothetical protein